MNTDQVPNIEILNAISGTRWSQNVETFTGHSSVFNSDSVRMSVQPFHQTNNAVRPVQTFSNGMFLNPNTAGQAQLSIFLAHPSGMGKVELL